MILAGPGGKEFPPAAWRVRTVAWRVRGGVVAMKCVSFVFVWRFVPPAPSVVVVVKGYVFDEASAAMGVLG